MATSNRLKDAARDWSDVATVQPGNGASSPAGPAEAPERPTMVTAPLEPVNYDDNEIRDAEVVPVHTAWSRVMGDIQSISKADRRDDTGGRYNFRGVDRVVNAVGPAVRRHGVLVLPTKILSVEYKETRTSKGNPMQECTVTVQWTVMGPKGDTLPPLESAGQATDTQDKACSKAISVAQRVLFLTALQIPTQDPETDRGHERGDARFDPAAYRDEALDQRTSVGRLQQMLNDLKRLNRGTELVQNEFGEDEKLGSLIVRVGRERQRPADESGAS
jgi:hypothetical protein